MKQGNGNDFDYLLFDQIWKPQLCYALSHGYDPTLSHLQGSLCQQNILPNASLGIHGLWPNYYGGFPQCCLDSTTRSYFPPLTPASVQTWSIWPQLQAQWSDPTVITSSTSDSYGNIQCNTCYMLNHEFQKHGSCFSNNGPEDYFTAGLLLASNLANQTAEINSYPRVMLSSESSIQFTQPVPISTIQAMYEKRVNVICDPHASVSLGSNVFLEIQTCWRQSDPQGFYIAMDCPPASKSTFTEPCRGDVVFLA